MNSDRTKLRRAQLIERLRAAEHGKAASDACRAEAERIQLIQLAERTKALALLYTTCDNAHCGADLRAAHELGGHLRGLGATAAHHAVHAGTLAEAAFTTLSIADRRRQDAADRRRGLARAMAERLDHPDSIAPRRTWHAS